MHSFATLHCSKRLGIDGGEEKPTISAPKEVKKSVSQEPLNPVCPVINTFFLFQKDEEAILPNLPRSVITFP